MVLRIGWAWLLAVGVWVGGVVAQNDAPQQKVDQAPAPRFQAKPVYPFYMRMSGIEGRVLVRFDVDRKGEVYRAYPSEFSHPGFRQSAVDAVERWRFRPGKSGGKTVAVSMTVPIVFNFDDGAGAAQGWTVNRPEKHPDSLPESLKWDEAPQLLVFNPPVYPRASVIAKKKGKVTVQFITSPDGGVVLAKVVEASSPELGGAAVAAVESFRFKPARRNGAPCGAILAMQFDFKLSDSSHSPVTPETLRVANLLRKKSKDLVGAADLDEVPQLLHKKKPIRPLAHRETREKGEVRVEIVVSRRGVVELPRILEATSPEFGYSAIQALSEWQFEPPRRDGRFVDTRMIVPVVFTE